MSDPDVPDQFGPGIRWGLSGTFFFVFVLISAEQFVAKNYESALIFSVLSTVTFVVIVKWHLFNQFMQRRVSVAFALIVFGAICMATGIFLLARSGRPDSNSQFTQQLTDLQQKNSSLSKELNDARAELTSARQNLEGKPQVNPQPMNVEYRRLSQDQMRILIKGLSSLKSSLGLITITCTAVDPQGEANQYRGDFLDAFNRAGVRFQTSFQQPGGPEETGVMLSVRDVNNPPASIQSLKALLESAAIQTAYVPLVDDIAKDVSATLFIGPKAF